MFKRLFFASVGLMALAGTALAQVGPTPLSVKSVRQFADGVDRVFEFEIANALDREVTAQGRVVLLNVYDASLPDTIQIDPAVVPSGGTATVAVRWRNAPLFGQIRALLVMTDGEHATMVESFVFWAVPYFQALLFIGLAALSTAAALAVMRLPKFLKERVPSGMVMYAVEYDDTVVTLSNRYGVTWQDIVRANRLKPPYELKPGSKILIPKHPLHKPEPHV